MRFFTKIQKRNPYVTFRIFSQKYRRYLMESKTWKSQGGTIDVYRPITSEYNEDAGTAKGHYFHQDLLVANFVYSNNPNRHIDVGSRIDGFVAHVASFREIEVLDIRQLTRSPHKNIIFRQADLMAPQAIQKSDSVSCLHALEHFGLGRYNDPISVDGFEKGIQNLVSLVMKGGMLYVSFPIATRTVVHFNAHRILNPNFLLKMKVIEDNMRLERFDFVDDDGLLHLNSTVQQAEINTKYGCGIYSLRRL